MLQACCLLQRNTPLHMAGDVSFLQKVQQPMFKLEGEAPVELDMQQHSQLLKVLLDHGAQVSTQNAQVHQLATQSTCLYVSDIFACGIQRKCLFGDMPNYKLLDSW